MQYKISLTISTPTIVKFKGRDVFRCVVVASSPLGLPKEIFIHQRTLINPNTLTYQNEFCAVASPYELSLYPVDEPNVDDDPGFFRKDTIDVYLPGIEIIDAFTEEVKYQVNHLLYLLCKLDDLSEEEVVSYTSCDQDATTTSTTTSTTTTPAP
jgi:hypothetical protein